MQEIFFNTSSNNKYLFLNNNIMHFSSDIYRLADDDSVSVDKYNNKKQLFLKRYLSNKVNDISFKTVIPSDIIERNIENLRQLLIEVTDDCNLACEYCGYGKLYSNYDERSGKKQTFEQVKILLDYLIDKWKFSRNSSYKNNVFIGFYGGEPLLNFKLISQVINYLESIDIDNIEFKYNMTTNAVLLDRYIDFLSEKNVDVFISLDGNKFNHSYRVMKSGKNSFDIVYKNIQKVRSKYPDYYDKSINFNAVLHNRNSFEEIVNFMTTEFNKVPRVSELSKVGISSEKIDEFNKMFQVKFDESNKKIDISETSDIEYILNDPDVSIFNLFIDSFVGNTYNNLLDLFEEENKSEYFPTGTCLPFQKKMFLTVNGKLLPCEKIGQERPLGFVDSKEVHIDYTYISNLYENLYSKIKSQCEKCFTWSNCGQCVFLLKEDCNKINCNVQCSLKRSQSYLAHNLNTAEKYPFLYNKLVRELIND